MTETHEAPSNDEPTAPATEAVSVSASASAPAPRVPPLASDDRVRWALLALLVACATAFAGLTARGLWYPDEPRVAGIGLAMLHRQSPFVPILGDQPFLEKPPLYWWVQMRTFEVLGKTVLAARLPSALFALLALWAVFTGAARLGGRRVGFYAVCALAATAQFTEISHRVLIDTALIAFVAWAHVGLLAAISPRGRSERWGGLLVAALSVPLAFLSKGVVGVGLAVGPPVLYLLLRRRWRDLWRLWPLVALGALTTAAFVTPWVLGLHDALGWDGVRVTVLGNSVDRILGGARRFAHHLKPVWFYLVSFPGHLLPWTVALPALVLRLRRERDPFRREVVIQALSYTLLGLVLLSVPSSKRGLYVAPLLPVAAIAAGWWLSTLPHDEAPSKLERWTTWIFYAVVGLGPLGAFLAALGLKLLPIPMAGLDAIRARLTPEIMAAFGVTGVSWAVAWGAWLATVVRGERRPSARWLAFGLVALVTLYQQVGTWVIDPVKRAEPVAEAVAVQRSAGRDVMVYQPREALVGLLYLELGVVLERADDPVTLEAALREHPKRWVLTRERDFKRLPQTTRAGLEVVWSDGDRMRKPHVLVARKGQGQRRGGAPRLGEAGEPLGEKGRGGPGVEPGPEPHGGDLR